MTMSTYPADDSKISVALDLLGVDRDPRIGAAVGRRTEQLDPELASVDYVTIDWSALEGAMRSSEDQRNLKLAHGLLETSSDEHGLFHLHDGIYRIVGNVEDGEFRVRLRRINPVS
jgi:hypothetical protein